MSSRFTYRSSCKTLSVRFSINFRVAYKRSCFFHQANLFFLQDLCPFVILNDDFVVRLLFRVYHETAIQFDELLETVVALLNRGAQLLNLCIFSLYLLVQMSYLRR